MIWISCPKGQEYTRVYFIIASRIRNIHLLRDGCDQHIPNMNISAAACENNPELEPRTHKDFNLLLSSA